MTFLGVGDPAMTLRSSSRSVGRSPAPAASGGRKGGAEFGAATDGEETILRRAAAALQ